ncbi:MAG: DUF6516 family protein [bacterium]
MIKWYFDKIQSMLREIEWLIKSENIDYDILSDEMEIIKGEIIFVDGSTLEFKEMIFTGITDYRFQYMGKNYELIRRWDTAPHHKEIKTFPYHMHTTEGVEESEKVDLPYVIEIIADMVIKKLTS